MLCSLPIETVARYVNKIILYRIDLRRSEFLPKHGFNPKKDSPKIKIAIWADLWTSVGGFDRTPRTPPGYGPGRQGHVYQASHAVPP